MKYILKKFFITKFIEQFKILFRMNFQDQVLFSFFFLSSIYYSKKMENKVHEKNNIDF